MYASSLTTTDEENTIQINKGYAHFEPVLSVQETKHHKQRSPGSSDYDNEITPEEELINTIRSRGSEEEKLEKIKRLFKEEPKPNVNFQDTKNNTPLHIAVSKRKVEQDIIVFLIGEGAKIDIKNDKGRSSLDIAKRLDRESIVKILESRIQSSQQVSVGEQSASQQQSHTQSQHEKLQDKQLEYEVGQVSQSIGIKMRKVKQH